MLHKSLRNSIAESERLYTYSWGGGENHFSVMIILCHDLSTRIYHEPFPKHSR